MRFDKIEISNFLSFGDKQEVVLRGRGLVAIFGVNKDSNKSDSNGSGKSSIMEALVWCLWGETLRGLKGDEVINLRAGKDCVVTLTLSDGEALYTITRTRKLSKAKKPNDLIVTVNGKEVSGGTNADTQETVDAIVGMDVRTFTQSVLLTGDGQSFCQMTDKEQKSVLEDILQVKEFARARDVVKTKIQNQTAKRNQSLQDVNAAKAVKADAEARLLQYAAADREFARNTLKRLIEIAKRKAELELSIEQREDGPSLCELVALEKELSEKDHAARNQLQTASLELERAVRKISAERARLDQEIAAAKARLTQLDKLIKHAETLSGTVCPTCTQDVPHALTAPIIAGFNTEGVAVREKIGTLSSQRDKLTLLEKEWTTKLRDRMQGLNQESAALARERLAALGAQKNRESDLMLIWQLDKQTVELTAEQLKSLSAHNPYTSLIEESTSRRDNAQAAIALHEAHAAAYDREIKHLEFWDHGFGNAGLKSYLLDNVIPFLNERAQAYADILSGGDIKIKFSTQTQLKSGDWKEQFQVQVVNSQGADVYRGNSAGEKRRSDISVGWALGDLAATRARKPIMLKLLDETFEGLDFTGKESVFKLLNAVISQYESIFCITHDSELQSMFPTSITVVKKSGNSVIQ